MPTVSVNLGENSGPIGAGNWLVEIENVEMDEKNSEYPALVARCRVVEPEDNKGSVHFERITLGNPDFGWVLDRFLEAAGVETPSEQSERENFELDTDELLGKSVIVVTVPQPDNPQYTNTRGVFPASNPTNLTLGPAE